MVKNYLSQEEALLDFREKPTIVLITLAGIEGIKVKRYLEVLSIDITPNSTRLLNLTIS